MTTHLINGLIIGSSYVLIAAGLTLIFGILDVINLGHGEIYMIGAFTSYVAVTVLGLNFWNALILSMIVVALLGVLIEKLLFKPLRNKPLLNTMLVSIAMAVLFQNLAMLIWGSKPKLLETPLAKETVTILGATLTMQRLIVIIVGLLLIIGLHLLIEKTTIGKAMRATSQDKEAAMLMGINIDRVYTTTFAIGCALAAAAGTLIGPIFLISPSMGFIPFIKAFTVVILGGLGNIMGAIYAGLILGVVESFGAVYISTAYKDSFAFIILILMLLFRPSGLMGRG